MSETIKRELISGAVILLVMVLCISLMFLSGAVIMALGWV